MQSIEKLDRKALRCWRFVGSVLGGMFDRLAKREADVSKAVAEAEDYGRQFRDAVYVGIEYSPEMQQFSGYVRHRIFESFRKGFMSNDCFAVRRGGGNGNSASTY